MTRKTQGHAAQARSCMQVARYIVVVNIFFVQLYLNGTLDLDPPLGRKTGTTQQPEKNEQTTTTTTTTKRDTTSHDDTDTSSLRSTASRQTAHSRGTRAWWVATAAPPSSEAAAKPAVPQADAAYGHPSVSLQLDEHGGCLELSWTNNLRDHPSRTRTHATFRVCGDSPQSEQHWHNE